MQQFMSVRMFGRCACGMRSFALPDFLAILVVTWCWGQRGCRRLFALPGGVFAYPNRFRHRGGYTAIFRNTVPKR